VAPDRLRPESQACLGWRKTVQIERRLMIDGWLPAPYSKGVARWLETAQPQTRQPHEEYPPSERNLTKPKTICPSSPLISENLRHSQTASRRTNQGSRKGAAGRCYLQRLSQGVQRVTLRRAPCFMRPAQAVSPNPAGKSLYRVLPRSDP
jgi:hypothetical protein